MRASDALRHVRGRCPRHHHHAVHVGHDHVAGANRRAGADHRHIHRAGRGLHCPLRMHRLGPHREHHAGEVRHVADAGVDQQSDDAVGAGRHRQQLAEHPVGGRRRGRHHQHVALAAQLDRRVDHQVVAGLTRDGDGAARHLRRRIDRPHVGLQQPRAALRLVHGGHAALAERLDHGRLGAVDVADDGRLHACTCARRWLIRGYTLRTLPSKILARSASGSAAPSR